MKKFGITKLTTLITGALFLNACATTSVDSPEAWNKKQVEMKSPLRLVKDDTFLEEGSTKLVENWAGVPGRSKINRKHRKKALNKIEDKCGYGRSAYKKAHIINHGESSWEEVWLFNDPDSLRNDQLSGITLFFEYDPQANKTSFSIFGECHTRKGIAHTIPS
ncbi:MAG: hypothetical protein GY787_30290 [Alteromonadales bacterium]|nr:hypothetical protein [Alteromonadales bacterium]